MLFTRTSAAIRPRTLQHIRAELISANVPIFEAQMHEREAFRAMFSFGGPVGTLNQRHVSNLAAAEANARQFAAEVLGQLRDSKIKRPVVAAA